ncbi:hypothetical protein ACFWZT_12230 [Streptomyces alboflavus]|uniref:hypothetical protein n=1 Tax=Streptomyces alboflavus TaxID=67267 RepID=UPI0036B3D741
MLDPWAAASLSPDDFRRAFAVATAPLMAGFDTSLDRPGRRHPRHLLGPTVFSAEGPLTGGDTPP